MATSRLLSVRTEACADEVDLQVDLRSTWRKCVVNKEQIRGQRQSRPPGLVRRHEDRHSSKKKKMTLGPKFFSCNKMTITRRSRHLRQFKELSRKALDVYYVVALSKHDLKPSGTCSWKIACDLGFAGYVFRKTFVPEGDYGMELTMDAEQRQRSRFKQQVELWDQ